MPINPSQRLPHYPQQALDLSDSAHNYRVSVRCVTTIANYRDYNDAIGSTN
jgi:hypothetical protein